MPDRDTTDQHTGRRQTGFGRFLVALYALFSLAAGARSAVQISTNFAAAPLAYTLSAVAAVIYILATFALATDRIRWARPLCLIELIGVLAVGTLSYVVPHLFPDQTVWSHFGQGYFFIPVVLPIAALWWIRRTTQSGAAAAVAPDSGGTGHV